MAKTETIKVGDRISHSLFGGGFAREISRSGNGQDIHIHCEFDEVHQRSESAPATRFRKIISTYLEKIDWEETVSETTTINPINISGLESSGLVKFDFSSDEDEEYEPTAAEKAESDEEDEGSLEDLGA